MFRSFGTGTCSRIVEWRMFFVGEPVSTSPEHALEHERGVEMPKGYKAYMAATPPAHHKYTGVALVRGGTCEVMEGRARSRNVLREFPDYATALACYRSPEYQ